jgi:SAM-dependent methyltransferase
MKNEAKFIHNSTNQNVSSPRKIIPLLFKYVNPKSVVDIGCGTGRFLKVFKEFGISDILGVDGNWVNRELLRANINENEFHVSNLEKFNHLELKRKFDLAVCIEVAEHIDQKYSDALIENLTALSDYILFSAAIPYQGGQHHVNEQWADYWEQKFESKGFVFQDIFRNELWSDPDVQYWFKQNLFLVVRKDKALVNNDGLKLTQNYVHPQLYLKRASKLNHLLRGNEPVFLYIKLLAKAVAKRILMINRS